MNCHSRYNVIYKNQNMDLYNQKSKSYPQKIVLTVLEIVIILISYWILFENGYNKIFHQVNPVTGNYTRHLILFIFNIVVFLRILVTTFYLIKRRMPWEEAFSIPFAFALYYIGFALFGYKSELKVGLVGDNCNAAFPVWFFLKYRLRTGPGYLEKKA